MEQSDKNDKKTYEKSSCKKYKKSSELSIEEKERRNRIARESYFKNREKKLKRQQEQYHQNPEKKLKYQREYHKLKYHKDKTYSESKKNKLKERYQKDKQYRENKLKLQKEKYHNCEDIRVGTKKHYMKNKEQINENQRIYHQKQYHENLHYKIKNNIRSIINESLRIKKTSKNLEYIIGCKLEIFREHIESQFKPGMTWDNRTEWHLDHIKPIKSFDLTILADIKKCYYYKNFQVLWSDENRQKAASVKNDSLSETISNTTTKS